MNKANWNLKEEERKLDNDIKHDRRARGDTLSSSSRVKFEEPDFNFKLRPKVKKAGIINKILAKFK